MNKLDELEALLAKATPGYPGGPGRGDPGWRSASHPKSSTTRITGCNRELGDREWVAETTSDNAKAIIALRNAAPALLAVARAAAWVRKAYELDEDDNDFAAEFCAALDKLETDQ